MDQHIMTLLSQCNSALNADNIVMADELVRKASAADPASNDVLFAVGRVKLAQMDYHAAISAFETVNLPIKNTALFRSLMGEALLRIGRCNDGIRELNLAYEISPEGEDYNAAMVRILIRCGDYPGAVKAADKLAKNWPDDVTTKIILQTPFRIGLHDYQANSRLVKTNFTNSNDFHIALLRGHTSFRERHYESALRYYQEAFHINEGNLDAALNIARTAMKLSDVGTARKILDLILEQQPCFAYASYCKGLAEKDARNLKSAISCFRKSLALDKYDPKTYVTLGRTYMNMGKFAQVPALVWSLSKISYETKNLHLYLRQHLTSFIEDSNTNDVHRDIHEH